MESEYERRLSQANRIFSQAEKSGGLGLSGLRQERRSNDRRLGGAERRELADRRQQELVVEHERRQQNRRERERRSFVDRRVTSDWSQERLEEERARMRKEFGDKIRFWMAMTIFFGVLLFLHLILTRI